PGGPGGDGGRRARAVLPPALRGPLRLARRAPRPRRRLGGGARDPRRQLPPSRPQDARTAPRRAPGAWLPMATDAAPHWRGAHPPALITTDMDAPTRFYHGVLGARLVATIGTPAFRHYFFEFGPEQTVAFFEYKGVELERWAKPAGVPDPRATQFDHLSFN